MRESARKRYEGRRLRDLEEIPGHGVYTSWEYKEARKRLIEGRPCSQCGSTEGICAHHKIAGDDESLVPLCRHCHPTYQVSPWYKQGEEPPQQSLINPAVYEGKDHAEALARLVTGRPCVRCESTRNIKGHHRVQGDHESLIPLCSSCHGWVYAHEPPYNPRGQHPPPGEVAPKCHCGCNQDVLWKPTRGWGKYVHGHANAIKVPAGTCNQEAPLCACGCGQPVKFTFGKGWNKYKQGHSDIARARKRREEGFISVKPSRSDRDIPACMCGCGLPTQWARGKGWAEYRRGHQPKEPLPEGPRCLCGCGEPVEFYRGKWRKFRVGHVTRIMDHRRGAKLPPRTAPLGEVAPKCRCGCLAPVSWKPYRGWAVCLRGHATTKRQPQQ